MTSAQLTARSSTGSPTLTVSDKCTQSTVDKRAASPVVLIQNKLHHAGHMKTRKTQAKEICKTRLQCALVVCMYSLRT